MTKELWQKWLPCLAGLMKLLYQAKQLQHVRQTQWKKTYTAPPQRLTHNNRKKNYSNDEDPDDLFSHPNSKVLEAMCVENLVGQTDKITVET